MNDPNLILQVVFYKSELGNEPVREWLKSLSRNEKKIIGTDVKTVQFGWPMGIPLVKKLVANLWEVRISLDNKIARVIFTVKDDKMILLHGFIKKSQKLPEKELDIAKNRLNNLSIN